MVVDGGPAAVVTQINANGVIQRIASIPAYHNGSCATDNLILLTFGYENGSPGGRSIARASWSSTSIAT